MDAEGKEGYEFQVYSTNTNYGIKTRATIGRKEKQTKRKKTKHIQAEGLPMGEGTRQWGVKTRNRERIKHECERKKKEEKTGR